MKRILAAVLSATLGLAPLVVESNGVRLAFLACAGPFGEPSGWHTTDAEGGPDSPGWPSPGHILWRGT